MNRKRRRVPPSRVRYEQENPTVSCRVPRLIYNQLKNLKLEGNKSLGDILREALGVQAPDTNAAFL